VEAVITITILISHGKLSQIFRPENAHSAILDAPLPPEVNSLALGEVEVEFDYFAVVNSDDI